MSARIFALAAVSFVGSGAALLFDEPGLATVTAALATAVAVATRRTLLLLIAAASMGWMLGSQRIASIEGFAPSDLDEGEVAAVVIRPPRAFKDQVLATVEILSGELAERRISLIVRQPPWISGNDAEVQPLPRLDLGDTLIIRALDPKPIQTRSLHQRIRRLREGIVARAYLDRDELEVTGAGGGVLVRAARVGRSWLRSAADLLPEGSQGLLLGVTIGDTSQLSAAIQEDFRRTGLTHLVAVSGANVAIVLGALLLLLRAVRMPVRAHPWMLAAAVACFCAVSAFEPSVVRASFMASLVLAAGVVGAARRAIHLLGVALLILSVLDPFIAFELGFQLSVLATLGLLTLARRLIGESTPGPLLLAGAATLGAQLATTPLLALTTERISLVSLPANLLAGPAVAPATVVGLVAGVAGGIVPPLRYLALIAHPFLQLMLWTARLLADLPFAVVAVPSGVTGIVLILSLVALVWLVLRRGARSAVFVLALSLLVPSLIGVAGEVLQPRPLSGLTITMLDVGQGESILIREGEHAMLIDGGPDTDQVARELRDRGIHRLEMLVVSHAHDDHISGLVPVAERATIGAILDPGMDAALLDLQVLKEAAQARGIPWIEARSGQTFALGRARVEILWPREPLMQGTDSDLNENSIVMRVRFGSASFLYSGETQELAQEALLEWNPSALVSDVLKVSHHGSARMDPDFYRATGADIALIPVGENRYGHPSPLTLIALDGMRILRSDEHGDVSVTLDGRGGVAIRTGRRAAA